MKTFLKIEPPLFDELTNHLLPVPHEKEQAAFLFVRLEENANQAVFKTIDFMKLGPDDFSIQEGDYIEMEDETRVGLIKKAHTLKASLVEIHSHLGPWKPAFSFSDRVGLRETVRHMWWRLNKRPYLALVFAKSGFDALVWLNNPDVPRRLDAIWVGDQFLKPTDKSLRGWE